MNSRIKEDVTKIFEFWCDVAKSETNYHQHFSNLHHQNGNSNIENKNKRPSGIILESFPESYHDEQIITKIPDFAYPCEFENDSIQSYSFVLTSDDSKWRFGFCRHDPKTQTAMVIITYLPWHDTFLRLLSVLGELKRNKNGEFESFLTEAYNRGVPELGGSLKLFYNCGQNHFIFQRPSQFQLPSIPENHNLNLYYNFVEPKNMISVFAAMLAERRIIFTSRRFDKLSSCIQAANAFLYPMVWQHIFIPVLPMKMKDILSAPMPYLIGVPEAVLQTMTPEELGDVVILNCDNGLFESPFDDVKPMPSEIVSQMKKQLSNSSDHIGDRVSKIFLGVLVQLIGGYRDAVQFPRGQKVTWDRDTFIESRPPHLRQFLTKIMELQIFQQFIEERLEMLNTGLGFSDEFELETLRYAEKVGRRGKNYKEFLRNVKEKTNPAVKSAVKSVKESSRGVKTAYKDLKSKLRDITPPKSQFHSHITTTSLQLSSSTYKYDSKGFNIDKGRMTSRGISDNTDGHHRNHHQLHRSAPSSPIFSKRLTNNIDDPMTSSNLTNSTYNNNKYGSSLQTSNSQILNGFKNYSSPTSSQSNRHNINSSNSNNTNTNTNQNQNSKSPTISPTSSLCSSDMNISQELQNHPLFKTPVVDRSLKPSNSLEYYGSKLNAKNGPQITIPSSSLSSSSSCSLSNQKSPSSTSQSEDNLLINKININDKQQKKQQTQIKYNNIMSSYCNTTDSLFDTPPDMLSPPIPPKRTNHTHNDLSFKHSSPKNNCSQQQKQQVQNSISSSRHITSQIPHCNHQEKLLFPSMKENKKGYDIPIPIPRQKLKEINQKQKQKDDETTKDLISLYDSNNTSFELEDFDPLNQNAKPFPSFLSNSQPKSIATSILSGQNQHEQQQHNIIFPLTSTSLPSSSAHNPLYSYFSLQHSVNSITQATTPSTINTFNHSNISSNSVISDTISNIKNSATIKKNSSINSNIKDDDFELLRKYGLDQFTLTNGTSSLTSATTTKALNKSNWTVFD